MANGRINFGKQSGGVLGLVFPDGATNTEVTLPESGTLATTASATETAQGLIELATTAETQDGTDDSRAITPLKLKNSVLGLGQTWQDVTASRVAGTTYTNSTGKPIFLAISVANNSALNLTTFLQINSIVIAKTQFVFNGDDITVLNAIVPNGATYKITTSNVALIQIWQELR